MADTNEMENLDQKNGKSKELYESKDEIEMDSDFEELENLINESTKNLNPKEEEIDEEDLALIAENAGLDGGKSSRKRVFLEDATEDEDEEILRRKPTRRRDVQTKIDKRTIQSPHEQILYDNDAIDDFIVDDLNYPPESLAEDSRKHKEIYYTDLAAQQNDDIFGDDFDADELNETVEKTEQEQRQFLKDTYEPAELERFHLTQTDIDIRLNDIPERMQRRTKPVESCESSYELNEESSWIFQQAFLKKPLFSKASSKDFFKQSLSATETISVILDLIRNKKFEVPFIWKYRKELYCPLFDRNDLWKIYDMDNEWMYLKERKSTLISLMVQMRNYQKYYERKNLSFTDLGAPIELNDIDLINKLPTLENVKDYYDYFSFYYMEDLRTTQTILENELSSEELVGLKLLDLSERRKPQCFNPYEYCKKNGMMEIIGMFGISSKEFAENIKENYQKHVPRKKMLDPITVATSFVNKFFKSAADVVSFAVKAWALELAHDPIIRNEARTFYFSNIRISCRPTTLGLGEIDESHPYKEFKYLREKPISAFSPDKFLQLLAASDEGLITIHFDAINQNGQTIIEQYRSYYERDEYGSIVQEWNRLRRESVTKCFNNILFRQYEKEFKNLYHNEAQKIISSTCCKILKRHLNMSDDQGKSGANYVFGISLPPFQRLRNNQAGSTVNDGSCVVVSSDGSFIESFSLNSVLCARDVLHDIFLLKERQATIEVLAEKIKQFNPVSVVFNLDRRSSIDLYHDFKDNILVSMELSDKPNVEIINPLVSNFSAKTKSYSRQFPNFNSYTKQAISACRYSLDPLLETLQLFEEDDDIVSLALHPLHRLLSKDILSNMYQRLLIDVVNSVGFDINRCYSDRRYSNMLKYIAGLGPSKSAQLLMLVRKHGKKIKTRSELITLLKIGPSIFVNCAGFIKIVSNIEMDDDIEPLDNTRIHPESYFIARSILSQVFEIDQPDSSNYVESMLEILADSSKIYDFDLEEFSKCLKSDGLGEKLITVQEIRDELCAPYADKRPPYHILNDEDIFWVFGTEGLYSSREFYKDPNNSLCIGNLLSVTIIGFVYRRPTKHNIRDSIPKNEIPVKYSCPFCLLPVPDDTDIWAHVDRSCNGITVGIKVKLESGLSGFISKENITGTKNERLEDYLHVGMVINARVISANERKLSVDLSYKVVETNEKKSEKYHDPYFDTETEKVDIFKDTEKKEKLKNRVVYHKKLVVHPLFRNITFEEAENFLRNPQNDCIIRPSSKGIDRLAVSIKIADGIICHIDVHENEKPNDFALGKKLLIYNEVYEDLDEIYARFVTSFLNNFKEITKHKFYFYAPDFELSTIEAELKRRGETNNKRIPYLLSISKTYPGKVYLAYLAKSVVRYEYITVTHLGYSIHHTLHRTIDSVISWFKNYNKDDSHNTVAGQNVYSPRYDKYTSNYSNYPPAPRTVTNQPLHRSPHPMHG
ncbi:hypothetical protein HZS_6390, partial [Henneguya salminicola]